jgi:uncharacterized protein (DUF58 family)
MKERKFPLVSPTAGMFGLLFVMAAMWYGSASQNNAAAYLLLFCLLGVFLISIPHTLLNLGGLRPTVESAKPTFAGHEVALPVEIVNESRVARSAVSLSLPDCGNAREQVDHIAAGKAARVTLRFPALQRGEHEIGRLCLTTVYPLGFLRAWKRIATPQGYLVYPKPAGDPNLPKASTLSTQNKPAPQLGEGDDFAGVRAYVPGESQRHIDWKAVARGQELMTKQFTAESGGLLYLDFAAARANNLEDRLSQLALWVIEAERARVPYGLRLPATEIAPAVGQSHFHHCLRALALFK